MTENESCVDYHLVCGDALRKCKNCQGSKHYIATCPDLKKLKKQNSLLKISAVENNVAAVDSSLSILATAIDLSDLSPAIYFPEDTFTTAKDAKDFLTRTCGGVGKGVSFPKTLVKEDGKVVTVNGGRLFICACSCCVDNSQYSVALGREKCPFFVKLTKKTTSNFWSALPSSDINVFGHNMFCTSLAVIDSKIKMERLLPVNQLKTTKNLDKGTFDTMVSQSGFSLPAKNLENKDRNDW